jgi:hypothetical protein
MMNKVTKLLVPESPVDKLPSHYAKLYESLPEIFTVKAAQEIGVKQGLKESSIKSFIIRSANKLFKPLERGTYERIY